MEEVYMSSNLKIQHDGKIICWTGTLIGFLADVQNIIVPLVDTYLVAVFDDIEIIVTPDDNAQTLYQKYKRSQESMNRIVEKS